MIQVRLLMGMPITIEIVDENISEEIFNKIFEYLDYVDKKFSTYKEDSEISKINRKEISAKDWSSDMKYIFSLAEKTKNETNGYFDILDNSGKYNPSGLVKGWAIYCATQILQKDGFENFYIQGSRESNDLSFRSRKFKTIRKNFLFQFS